jgi:indoleamine 2,3-dioxygenase
MRDYMPPGHRAFLAAVERGTSAHDAVAQLAGDHSALGDALDCCLRYLEEFRSIHLEYAARYIHSQSQRSDANPTEVGTGGTPFMPYLAKHRDETKRQRMSSSC